MIKKQYFYDYLKICNYDFKKCKYIIFSWSSWSWKSTYINKLLNNNWLSKDIVIIDEIFDFIDLLKIFIQLCSKKQFIVASHLTKNYFLFFKLFWEVKIFKTDENVEKIYHYLEYKNYTFSKKVVKEYVRMFSSTYTDIDILLEWYNWGSFDEAFKIFTRYNKIKLVWNKNNIKIYGKKK